LDFVVGDLRKKIEDQNGIFFDEQVIVTVAVLVAITLPVEKLTACSL